jgi:hypothetical protein
MSSWGFAAGWLVVAGTTLLTIGTGAQARASLDTYTSSREAVLTALSESPAGKGRIRRYVASMPAIKRVSPFGLVPALLEILTFISLTPSKLADIRSQVGEEAAELSEYLRSTAAWGVLMGGSVLVLAATVIQLVLAYQ